MVGMRITCIPNSIYQFICRSVRLLALDMHRRLGSSTIAVKVSGIISQLTLSIMRHGCEMCGNLGNFQASSSVVHQGQILEGASLTLPRNSVYSRTGRLEPKSLVVAGIVSRIAEIRGDPKRAFRERDANVLLVVRDLAYCQ